MFGTRHKAPATNRKDPHPRSAPKETPARHKPPQRYPKGYPHAERKSPTKGDPPLLNSGLRLRKERLMPAPTSARRRRANRRNARSSTGPRTPEGKRRSSRNALKHGLLAAETVILEGDGAEDREQFDALLADLIDDLQPATVLEQTFVERIANCYWRLRRAQRYETGAIRDNLDEHTRPQPGDSGSADLARQELEEAQVELDRRRRVYDALRGDTGRGSAQQNRSPDNEDRSNQPAPADPGTTAESGDEPSLAETLTFTAIVPALNRIAADLHLPPYSPASAPSRGDLVQCFLDGTLPDPLSVFDQPRTSFVQALKGAGFDPDRDYQRLIDAQQAVVEEQGQTVAGLYRKLEQGEEYDRLRRRRRSLTGSIPDLDTLPKLVRYESMLDRQLHRALTQLQKLQKDRRTQKPKPATKPPPSKAGWHAFTGDRASEPAGKHVAEQRETPEPPGWHAFRGDRASEPAGKHDARQRNPPELPEDPSADPLAASPLPNEPNPLQDLHNQETTKDLYPPTGDRPGATQPRPVNKPRPFTPPPPRWGPGAW